jgi:hypothetical protein
MIRADPPPGRFSMVCRNARTHKAHPVHPLEVSTPEERALYGLGDRKAEIVHSTVNLTETLRHERETSEGCFPIPLASSSILE